jgi:hypothetical protein
MIVIRAPACAGSVTAEISKILKLRMMRRFRFF